ncbi:MAG: YceI family protein [Streptosporangiaceae bacterium]
MALAAVGRSGSVSGQMVIRGTTVRTASFTVQMATIHTDSAQRDAQFDGWIMDVAAYPTGTFALTKPESRDHGVPARLEAGLILARAR